MKHPAVYLRAARVHARMLADLFECHARRLFVRRAGTSSGPSRLPAQDSAASAVGGTRTSVEAESGVLFVQRAQSTRHDAHDSLAQANLDDVTVVKPASFPDSGSLSDSSLNRDSWQRVAQAQGGDHAAVGRLLKERFLLERELGRGGMGVVYLARDERKVEARDRDPYVAVKVLNDEFRCHPDALIALQREARRAQRLADDNIVHVYDFDKDGTIVFMTMEYVDGTDLRTLIRERPSGMPFRDAWPLIEGMARALQRAHASGIVHSDFKPGNVMVTRDGVAKVFDFGIARAARVGAGNAGEQTVFDAGTLGAMTPAYASLDMFEGAEPTVRDDVYAFGCIVFELLTGRHPFDGRSADVAMAEGALPPAVPSLSRRQYRALCDAVGFRGDARLQTVGALAEGLRRRRPHERLAPYLPRLLAVAACAAGGAVLHSHYRQWQFDTTIARFAVGDPYRYVDEDQAMAALSTLDVADRERLVLNQNDTIQRFLAGRLDAYWSPPLGRLDYAAVQHVFQVRDQLKLFSPGFDMRRKQIDDERIDMLTRLGGSLDEAVDRDTLFEDEPGNAADILRRIRLLDPGSARITNTRLELKYDAAIGQSIDFGKFDEARARLALAMQLFPGALRLERRHGQLEAAIATASAHPKPHAGALSVTDARRSLNDLAANPSTAKPWLDALASAMATLQGDDAPDTGKAIEMLADGIVNAAARVSEPSQAHQTLDLIEVGLRYAPHSPALAEQRDRILSLLQQQRIDQQIASGDAAAQIDAVRAAAAVYDGTRALAALNRLRTLQPDDAFLVSAGPQLVANAYLGNARMVSRNGKLTDAARIASQGAEAMSGDSRLGAAAQRYRLADEILQARAKPMADPDLQDLQARFSAACDTDADAMRQFERDIGGAIALPPGGLSAVLDQIRAQVEGDSNGASASNADDMAVAR
jgi:non-specific serine/threonine protein kinase